jgi:hypothetical protein
MRGRYSDSLKALVDSLLVTNPSARPHVSEILALPYIKQCLRDLVAFNPGPVAPPPFHCAAAECLLLHVVASFVFFIFLFFFVWGGNGWN